MQDSQTLKRFVAQQDRLKIDKGSYAELGATSL